MGSDCLAQVPGSVSDSEPLGRGSELTGLTPLIFNMATGNPKVQGPIHEQLPPNFPK